MEKNTDALELRAYHEAGHVVVAYLSGYSCRNLKITEKNPLENRESFDFGKDTELIFSMYQYKNDPENYDNLSPIVKDSCRKVALKTIIVLLGGAAAEIVYKNNGKAVENPLVKFAGDDLEAADKIDYFLTVIKHGQHATNYLKVVFRQVMELLVIKEVWSAVSAVANAVMNSESNTLERKKIEKILLDTGFLSYLTRLRLGKTSRTQQTPQSQQTAPAPQIIRDDQPVESQSDQTAQAQQPASAPQGFSREELLKMKEDIRNKPQRNVISKKEGMSKVAAFTKGNRLADFKIGLADSIEQLRKIDKSRYVAFDVKNYEVARDILMYFICMGMEVSPGSTQNKNAATVFVVMTEFISPGTGT